MPPRRAFIIQSLAAASLIGGGGLGPFATAAAQDRYDQDTLLEFAPFGNVTLMHLSDIHGQMMPLHDREPSVRLGVDADRDTVPYLTGEALRVRYGIGGRSPMDHALTHEDFTAQATAYGKMGGLDRVATVVRAIRRARPGALLLDGGNTFHGSFVALKTQGQDMVDVMTALGVDAMTFGWEFTLGAARVREIVAGLPYPVLAQNVTEAGKPADLFKPYAIFIRNGAKIAVIGQADPFLGEVHPHAALAPFTFGLHAERLQKMVAEARAEGAAAVILLSQNGFALDRELASQIKGIDVILTGRTHVVTPEPEQIGDTYLIASGANGRFMSRLYLDLREGRMMGLEHKLIPVFSDLITPDPSVTSLIDRLRAPFADDLSHRIAQSDDLLYRRGTLTSSWDALICDALRADQDAQVALCPAFPWGATLLPGQTIAREDIFNLTAISYPNVSRSVMRGDRLKHLLETAADAVFNADPLMRQGGDMLRVGGIGYRIDPQNPRGIRIGDLKLLDTGAPVTPDQQITVAAWGGVDGVGSGPPIWDVLERYLARLGQVAAPDKAAIEVLPPAPPGPPRWSRRPPIVRPPLNP